MVKSKVLMVCLGNICRSPLAQGILEDKINKKDLSFIEVDSAGTSSNHVSEHPDRRSIEVAQQNHIDISKQKARQIQIDDLREFNHILVMDQSNYKNVLQLCTDQQQKEKVSLICSYLKTETPTEVPDPYFGQKDGFKHVFDLLNKALDEFIAKELL